jgi:hypothetical protein
MRSRCTYGSPSLAHALGCPGRRNRIARLMRLEHLFARQRSKYRVATTDSRHRGPIAPNRVRTLVVRRPNQVWATDATCILTGQGWLYLVAVLDVFSRRVIGWAMSQLLDAPLVITALRMALSQRYHLQKLIVHSEHDRTWTGGFVYTPKWVPQQWGSFTLTVDLWDVERTGVTMAVSPQSIINAYQAEAVPGVGPIQGIASPSRPKPGQTAVLFDPTGGFTEVSSPFVNGGKELARGIDLGLQYQIQTPIGTFSSLTRTTYLEDFVFAFPGSTRAFHVAGRANNDFIEGFLFGQVTGGDGWMRWRGTEILDWTWKNWDQSHHG